MSVYFLDRDDVLTAGAAALGAPVSVRDFGLLDAAVARPQSSVFGLDAYPDLWTKAAALFHSMAGNDALVDGNRRTAWAAAWVFLGCNGVTLQPGFPLDAAFDFIITAVTGDLDLPEIAAGLRRFVA